MKRAQKFIALIFALVLLSGLAAFAAVSTYNDPNNPKPGLLVDGKRVKDPGVIVTVGSYTIDFNEYRYYYLSQKSYVTEYQLEGDTSYWEQDPDGAKAQELKDGTMEYIKFMYTWLQIAKDKGVGISEEERTQLLQAIEEEKAEKGSTGFKEWLKTMHVEDEELYIRLRENQMIVQKMQTEYRNIIAAENEQEILTGAVSAKHILILFDTTAEDPEQNEQDVKEQMQGFYDEIMQAQDPVEKFEELREMYDEDAQGQMANDGYTFVEGQMVQEFYEAALALEEDEISKPVRTSYGYHIILKKPLDTEYVEQNKDSLLQAKIEEMTATATEEMMEQIPVVYGEYYDRITAVNVQ